MALVVFVTTDYTIAKRRSDTRKLAGNINSNDISDAELDDIFVRKDVDVFSGTNKFDWLETDRDVLLVIDASNHLAAAEIIQGIPGHNPQEVTNLLNEANRQIKRINGNTVEQTAVSAAKTNGINNQSGSFG